MPRYEYKVVPAPVKGRKAKGVKTPEGRFALSIEDVLNTMGAEGWEYLRAELLPSEERSGLTSTTTNWRNVLVFRRALEDITTAPQHDVTPGETIPTPPSLLAAGGLTTFDTNDSAPPVGPATRTEEVTPGEPEQEPEPEPVIAPPEEEKEEEDARADLDRLFAPEPEPEETVVVAAPPTAEDIADPAEPERRTPPDLSDMPPPGAAPEAAPAADESDAETTPDRRWQDEEDTEALSGIERVVRRTAAEQRDHSDDS